jgi:hypothetical protein
MLEEHPARAMAPNTNTAIDLIVVIENNLRSSSGVAQERLEDRHGIGPAAKRLPNLTTPCRK